MTPSQDFRDFIIWERETADTIDFKKIYVDMAGDLKAGLMLSQIVYWRLPRKNKGEDDTRLSIERDGRMWLAKADKDWWAEIRLSAREAASARKILEERGVVKCASMQFQRVPTMHLSIDEDRFMELWNQMLATPLVERQAGRIEPKIKREPVKNKGSKPTSGNRRKAQQEGAPAEAPAVPEAGEGESGDYTFRNHEITLSVISKLPFRISRDYPFRNRQITDSVKSYTESTSIDFFRESLRERRARITAHTANSAGPEHSSSGEAASPNPEGLRDPVTPEAGPEPHAEDLPFLDEPAAPVDPAELEAALARLGSPDGAAADAAGAPPQKLRVEAQSPAGQDGQATGTEQVPGGGGAARPDWLEALTPIAGLLDRPAAEPGSPTYRALKALAGKSLTKYLGEKTRTGQLPRSRWLHLAEAEIGRVRELAKTEAEVSGENMITLALRGLDRLIGARKPEEPAEGGAPAATSAQDPKLAAGQRCTVADQVGVLTLGVVVEVNAARYKIRFDDGNGRDIDRTVAAQLRTLKASSAPLPAQEPEAGDDAPLVPAGTTWRRVKGKDGLHGEQVTVKAVLGMKRALSNGTELPVYVITRDFEQVV